MPKAKPFKEMIEDFTNQVSDEYTYISGYETMSKPCFIKHNLCNKIFPVTMKMFLGVKQSRCPYCANEKRSKNLNQKKENYLTSLLDKLNNEYTWLETYSGDNKKKHKIRHNECNRTYEVRPNDFQQGYRCPHCANEKKESKKIQIVKKYLKQNKVIFNEEVSFDNLKNKFQLKFDIEIPKLNLLIEFDGQQHFREDLAFSKHTYLKQKTNDKIKNNWIVTNNKYNFVRIPYDISENDLILLIENIINKNKIDHLLIDKYSMFTYYNKKDMLYNTIKYYTRINKNYFIE